MKVSQKYLYLKMYLLYFYRHNGIQSLRVLQYGRCNYRFFLFNSLLDLVLYYSVNSLETHNSGLRTTLSYPINSL